MSLWWNKEGGCFLSIGRFEAQITPGIAYEICLTFIKPVDPNFVMMSYNPCLIDHHTVHYTRSIIDWPTINFHGCSTLHLYIIPEQKNNSSFRPPRCRKDPITYVGHHKLHSFIHSLIRNEIPQVFSPPFINYSRRKERWFPKRNLLQFAVSLVGSKFVLTRSNWRTRDFWHPYPTYCFAVILPSQHNCVLRIEICFSHGGNINQWRWHRNQKLCRPVNSPENCS